MNRNRLTIQKLALTIALCGAASTASADVSWDAVGDYSASSNPNGVWSYGYSILGTLVLLPVTDGFCNGLKSLTCWIVPGGATRAPLVGKNVGKRPIPFGGETPFDGGGEIPVGTLHMHPGPFGEQAVVTFTAPADGSYRFVGSFQAIDRTPTGVEVTVVAGHSTRARVSAVLDAFGRAAPFSFAQRMNAGQTMNFIVDAHGNYGFDSTELKVSALKTK